MPQEAVSNRENFHDGALLWLLISGLFGGVAGDWAEEAAEKTGTAKSMIGTQETLAFATLGFWGVLL